MEFRTSKPSKGSAIVDNGLMEVAQGLKESGSLLWTGTPIPQNLREIVETGVPVAGDVKIDSGQGTKIRDPLIDATDLGILNSGARPRQLRILAEVLSGFLLAISCCAF